MNLRNQQNLSDGGQKQILFAWNYLEWGGVQTYFLGLMRTAAEKYRVKAILPNGSDEKIIRYLKADKIEYDFFEGSVSSAEVKTIGQKIKRRINDLRANFALLKCLSKNNLKKSAVQIDVTPWSGFALLLYLVLRTNVFVTVHTAIPRLSFFRHSSWRWKVAVLKSFKRFHFNASNLDVKKSLRPLLSEKNYREMNVIYSSFNRAQFESALVNNHTKREIADKYNFPANKIWICTVGQFIERKGCRVFLEAIKILQNKRRDLFFCWLGTAALDEQAINKIAEYDLKSDFRFLSADEIGAERSDLLTLWQKFDIFALPSFYEGLPMVLVEAMALGKPCIASDIGAVAEAVENLETGVLVEAGDAEELARTIEKLADDPNLREKLGANARKLVFRNFEERITGRQMLRLYEEAV